MAKNPFAGDIWTRMAIDAETKLIPSWIVGPRDGVTARMFVNDLAGRLANRIQLTSDGLMHYNFARIHKTLRITPAMAAGVSDHIWELAEIAMLA